jgi:hypothetical protein
MLLQGGSLSNVELTILGAGLGGLTAAALLAKQRKKVVIFAPGNDVGGAFVPARMEGYQFTLGPTLSFGNEKAGVLQKLYGDLGISPGDIVRSTSYQVVLPDRRLTVYPEKNHTLDELRREYPREIDGIVSLFRAVDKIAERSSKSRLTTFLSQRRRSKTLLQRYRFSKELLSFFDVQSRYFFGYPVQDLPIPNLITLINTSPLYEPQGFKKMVDLLLEVILKHDGIVRFSEQFPEIVPQRGKKVGLMTTGGLLESKVVLLNTSVPRRDYFRFIGILDQGVPVGLRHGILCLPDYTCPDDLFSLNMSRQGDEYAAPRGKRALTVWFPFQTPVGDRPGVQIDPVGEIIPFLDSFCDTIPAHRPEGSQYATPSGMRGSNESPMVRLERGLAKNMFLIRDDARCPVQAVAAALRLTEILK